MFSHLELVSGASNLRWGAAGFSFDADGGGDVTLQYSTHTCASFYAYRGRVERQLCQVSSPHQRGLSSRAQGAFAERRTWVGAGDAAGGGVVQRLQACGLVGPRWGLEPSPLPSSASSSSPSSYPAPPGRQCSRGGRLRQRRALCAMGDCFRK